MRQGTPGSSPGRYTPVQSPSKLNQSYTANEDETSIETNEPISQPKFTGELPPLPTKGASSPSSPSRMAGLKSNSMTPERSDAATNLSAAQLREIREAFQVLDRDNDGFVDRDDVADVLANLGQDPSASAISRFFLPGSDQKINFPTFLNTLSALISSLSSSQELLNALAAFDDDDSGQIDVQELREALLHTSPEAGDKPLTEREVNEVMAGFTGRRMFGGKYLRNNGISGGGKRGEVFRYQEFVGTVVGGAASGAANGPQGIDAAQG